MRQFKNLELSSATTARVTRMNSSDVEEARQFVSNVFCDHKLTQNHRVERLNYRHLHVEGRDVAFSTIGYGADVSIDPGQLKSFYLVQMPLQGGDNCLVDGREFQSHKTLATVHSPRQALQMRWNAECRKFVVRISRDALERHAYALSGRHSHRPLEISVAMNMESESGRSWKRLALYCGEAFQQQPPLLDSSLLLTQFEQLIMTSLLAWQPNSALATEKATTFSDAAPRYVRLVEEYIEANCHLPLTLESLVEVAGIGGRSLFAAFRKFRHISPMQYLRNVRMERVHRELMNPKGADTVTEVAMRWGFFELGRFSAEYRRRFGEYPSATLKRSR